MPFVSLILHALDLVDFLRQFLVAAGWDQLQVVSQEDLVLQFARRAAGRSDRSVLTRHPRLAHNLRQCWMESRMRTCEAALSGHRFRLVEKKLSGFIVY